MFRLMQGLAPVLLFLTSCNHPGLPHLKKNQYRSKVLDFYSEVRSDNNARMVSDLWHLDDEALLSDEKAINWMFPLFFREMYANNQPPRLSNKDILLFKKNRLLNKNYFKSIARVFRFYGLNLIVTKKKISLSPALNFSKRMQLIKKEPKKHKRIIKRITASLKDLHQKGLAISFAKNIKKNLLHGKK